MRHSAAENLLAPKDNFPSNLPRAEPRSPKNFASKIFHAFASRARSVSRLRQIFALFNALLMRRALLAICIATPREASPPRVSYITVAGRPLREFPLKGLVEGKGHRRNVGETKREKMIGSLLKGQLDHEPPRVSVLFAARQRAPSNFYRRNRP